VHFDQALAALDRHAHDRAVAVEQLGFAGVQTIVRVVPGEQQLGCEQRAVGGAENRMFTAVSYVKYGSDYGTETTAACVACNRQCSTKKVLFVAVPYFTSPRMLQCTCRVRFLRASPFPARSRRSSRNPHAGSARLRSEAAPPVRGAPAGAARAPRCAAEGIRQRQAAGFPRRDEENRESDWQIAPQPKDLLDRRVEITGPTDRKMVINALNCGASTFMADFEDANCPTWFNMIDGQINLRDAVRRSITLEQTARATR
jgi:hypothetical protein